VLSELLSSKLKYPGPPIVLPTPVAITKETTEKSPDSSDELALWSWWTPQQEILDTNLNDLKTNSQKFSIDETTHLEVLIPHAPAGPSTSSATALTTQAASTTTPSIDTTHETATVSQLITTNQDLQQKTTSLRTTETTILPTDTESVSSNGEETTLTNVVDKDDVVTLANQSNLREKYVKLVEHNSQLVQVLKTTMEVQADLFKKILKYMFP